MADAATKPKPTPTTAEAEQELTDGFHLVIDALKINGINTIYGVPGIPITDLGRMAESASIRVIFFLNEQNACDAAERLGFRRVIFFFQAEDGIRDWSVTGVQTCALPI